MRDSFRGYYRPSSEEFDHLWNHGVVVLDANALLNVYRYSSNTTSDFLGVLHRIADQLWLPHQAGLEFQRNRTSAIVEQRTAFDKILSGIEKHERELEAELQKFRKHETLAIPKLIKEHKKNAEALRELVKKAKSEYGRGHSGDPFSDPNWEALSTLFKGKVGEPYSNSELKAIYDEGAIRYKDSIPPGYKDQGKGEPGCYGDLVIWKQLLRHCSSKQVPAVFVTDDGKDDWWRIENGRTLGPRVELVEEFWSECDQLVYFYSPEQFLRFAKDRLDADVSEESIGEARAVSEERTTDAKVHAQLVARREELAHRRDFTMQSLKRTEARFSLDDRIESLAREREMLRSRLSSINRENTSMRKYLESSASGARDIGGREVEEVRSLLAANEAHLSEVEDRLVQIDRSLNEARIVTTSSERRDSLLARLSKTEREIREVDDILQELGQWDASASSLAAE